MLVLRGSNDGTAWTNLSAPLAYSSSTGTLCTSTIPLFTVENISLCFQVDKSSQKAEGRVEFNLVVTQPKSAFYEERHAIYEYSFLVALGTVSNGILLSRHCVTVHFSGPKKKQESRLIELMFDWALANSFGGPDGGHIVLRVLSTEIRGMDLECFIPLMR
jgi:hypothetical protein